MLNLRMLCQGRKGTTGTGYLTVTRAHSALAFTPLLLLFFVWLGFWWFFVPFLFVSFALIDDIAWMERAHGLISTLSFKRPTFSQVCRKTCFYSFDV